VVCCQNISEGGGTRPCSLCFCSVRVGLLISVVCVETVLIVVCRSDWGILRRVY
jgi:hypothetical protein